MQVANNVMLPTSVFTHSVAHRMGARTNPITMTARFPAVGQSGPITGTLFNLPESAANYHVSPILRATTRSSMTEPPNVLTGSCRSWFTCKLVTPTAPGLARYVCNHGRSTNVNV